MIIILLSQLCNGFSGRPKCLQLSLDIMHGNACMWPIHECITSAVCKVYIHNIYIHIYIMITTVCAFREAEMPQQDNLDDCGVFSLMVASQLATSAGVHLIQPARMPEFRVYIAHCIIKQQAPGVLYTSPVAGPAGMQPWIQLCSRGNLCARVAAIMNAPDVLLYWDSACCIIILL